MPKITNIVSKVVYIILGFLSFIFGIKFSLAGWYFIGLLFLVIIPITIYIFFFNEKKYGFLNGLIAFYIIISPFLFVFNMYYNAFNDVNALWRYKGIIKDFGTSTLVSHFPKSIPENATDEKFSFSQIFMQKGGHINLKINVGKTNFDEIYNDFKLKQPNNIILPNFDSGFPDFRYIDEDSNNYETIYLTAEPYKSLNDKFPWNHGKASGISFNPNEYKIVYWAEFW